MAVVGAGNLEHPITSTLQGRDRRAGPRLRRHDRQPAAVAIRHGSAQHELEAKISQLERTQAQLVQSEKLASIGEMAAAVAHGLRNPLASLRAAAQVVRHHPEAPSSSEHLDAIIEEVDRLDRRISHLLSFSRPAPFRPMRESVPRLVEGLLPGVLRAAAGAWSAAGARHSARPAGCAGRSDAGGAGSGGAGLQRARRHAVRWPASDRGHLAEAGAGGEVAIEISDTGPGIPEHVLPSVCEPFFTTRPEGTGLGLAIAKRYVEQNGGRLEIASRPGAAPRCGCGFRLRPRCGGRAA